MRALEYSKNDYKQCNVDLSVSFLAGHSVGENKISFSGFKKSFKTCLNLVQKRPSYITELDKTCAATGLMAIADKAKGFHYEMIK